MHLLGTHAVILCRQARQFINKFAPWIVITFSLTCLITFVFIHYLFTSEMVEGHRVWAVMAPWELLEQCSPLLGALQFSPVRVFPAIWKHSVPVKSFLNRSAAKQKKHLLLMYMGNFFSVTPQKPLRLSDTLGYILLMSNKSRYSTDAQTEVRAAGGLMLRCWVEFPGKELGSATLAVPECVLSLYQLMQNKHLCGFLSVSAKR